MADKFQVVNPLTPMAYLQPEAANQFKIGTYVIVGCVGAFAWDLVENIYDDYRLVFQHKVSFPTVVYFLSRFSVLASGIMNAMSRTAPLGGHNCQNVQTAACTLYHIAFSSTALLFFLRARAIFNRNRNITAFFFALWLIVLAGSITVALDGGSGPLGPTDYCLAKPLNPLIGVSPVALFVNDTCVFAAISWRLMTLESSSWPGQGRQNRVLRIKRFILARDLPVLSRTLFQDGQKYYLASIASNILAIITITPIVSPAFHFMYVFNSIVTNMMACRVYRHTRFGDFREESISTVHWITPPEVGKPNPARFLHDGAAAAMTTSSSTVLDSVTTPEDGEKLRDVCGSDQWRSRSLFGLIVGLMIIIPVICITVCMHRRHMQT